MKITQHIHQKIRYKNWLVTFIILSILFSLAWLSRIYSKQIDLSANTSNTLSEASQRTLTTLPDNITITAYIKDPALKKQISQLIDKYRRFKKNIQLHFIDPNLDPEKTRELNIPAQGAFIVDYKGRTEKITFLDESTLTNTLVQLANTKKHWLTFLTGHGERSPTGLANFDLGLFGNELERRKINVQTINLTQLSAIPDNSSLLILAAPSVALLAGELTLIADYIAQGRNLLLLTDPSNPHLLSIEKQLGIERLPGTIVNSESHIYGIDDPTFMLVSEYSHHPITQNFSNITVFPKSTALEINAESDFIAEGILSSGINSWTETGQIAGKVRFDPDSDERQGPLTIAYALSREFTNKPEQRIFVIGDADFISNAFLGNVGNSELGFRIINWLIHEDQFIAIPNKKAIGNSLQFSTTSIAFIGFGFLLVIPLILMLMGIIIWRKRKRR